MAKHTQLPLQRFIDRLDIVLPAHTHHGGTGVDDRFWTTRAGQYRIITLSTKDSVSFHSIGSGWHVTVPRTGAGVDALVMAMVLAGAIDWPVGDEVSVRGNNVSWVAGQDVPGNDAFAFGLMLIDRSTRTGRY